MLGMTDNVSDQQDPKETYRSAVRAWIKEGTYNLKPPLPYGLTEHEARQIRIEELYRFFHPTTP